MANTTHSIVYTDRETQLKCILKMEDDINLPLNDIALKYLPKDTAFNIVDVSALDGSELLSADSTMFSSEHDQLHVMEQNEKDWKKIYNFLKSVPV